MRLAFVLLLATNVALLLWGLFIRTPPPPPLPPLPQGGSLQLIGEGGGEPAAKAGTSECLQLNPPLTAPAARRLAMELRRQGAAVTLQPSPATGRGYRVYTPPVDSLAEAADRLRRLQEAGFERATLAVGGINPNSIVVGRFGRLAAANEARRAVSELGLEARVAAPRVTVTVSTAADDLPVPAGSRWVPGVCLPAEG